MSRIKRIIKQQLNRNIETKTSVNTISDGTQIYHNNFVTLLSNPLKTTQGLKDPEDTNLLNRIGDQINLRGFSMKMMVELNERYSDVTFRMFVVRAARGDTPTRATLFNGLSGNKMIDTINRERYSILYNKTFKMKAPNAGTTGPVLVSGGVTSGTMRQGGEANEATMSRATRIVKMWIPGRKFSRSGVIQYDNGGSDPKFFDYHVLLYAYSNYSTDQDTWYVARVNDIVTQLYYKDG
jgi:hypothetical protein